MTLQELETLRNMHVKDIDRDAITDIIDITINRSDAKENKIREYLSIVSNPYIIKIGDVIVKMTFSEGNVALSECMERYLINHFNERL